MRESRRRRHVLGVLEAGRLSWIVTQGLRSRLPGNGRGRGAHGGTRRRHRWPCRWRRDCEPWCGASRSWRKERSLPSTVSGVAWGPIGPPTCRANAAVLCGACGGLLSQQSMEMVLRSWEGREASGGLHLGPRVPSDVVPGVPASLRERVGSTRRPDSGRALTRLLARPWRVGGGR